MTDDDRVTGRDGAHEVRKKKKARGRGRTRDSEFSTRRGRKNGDE